MYLTSLTLTAYRNLADLSFRPAQGINIITGRNAQGKTNLVEAIYLCCTGRSHRTPRDAELIRRGEEHAYVDLMLTRTGGQHRVQIGLNATGRKTLKLNGLSATRLGELMGHANAVMFSPEDLLLVKGGPALRRRFMDMELCQTDPIYFYDLQTCQKALLQRNALLKSLAHTPSLADTLDIWDEQLAKSGARISLKRREFINQLRLLADERHQILTGGQRLGITFHSATAAQGEEEAVEELMHKLKKNRPSDIRQAQTSIGPHREDLSFEVDGYDMRPYGSQGQKRSLALALKLAELDIMLESTGERPMLILDDVFSELDEERRRGLLKAIGETQTFITCVRVEAELSSLGGEKRLFTIQEGRLAKEA